jgi:hypothetical protein
MGASNMSRNPVLLHEMQCGKTYKWDQMAGVVMTYLLTFNTKFRNERYKNAIVIYGLYENKISHFVIFPTIDSGEGNWYLCEDNVRT